MQRFKKFFRKEIIIFLIAVVGVVFSLRFVLTSKFTSIVEPLFIPNIPDQFYTYMDSQIPRTIDLACGSADFKWFDYYDSELKTEVKVKRSGFCSYHYHSLTNSSMRIKYLNEDIRLKAFASEMNIVDNPFNSFSNLFSEYSVYTVLQSLPETRKYSPDARIVSINNDPEDIRVRWLDSTPDTVRETDQVKWKDLTRVYKYAPELAELYFDVAWKTRDTKISGLSSKFTDLLRPIFESFDKPLDGTEVTGFNNEDFMRFLALATTVGSTHINDHNLIFVADRKEDENKQVNFEWYPMLTDTNGFYFISEPLLPSFGYNPITEFFLRNPARVYDYFKYLEEYNELVLGSGIVSKHYEKFDCNNILRNKHFPNLLLQATHKDFITSDINGYCAAVEVFKDYDDKQYAQIKNKIDSASLHWNVYQAPGEANPVLVAWSFTPVPVKLNKIKCSNVDCSKDFQLINEPWWDKHTPDGVLLGEMTRLHSGNGNYAPKFSKYFYKYRYTGGGEFPDADSITVNSENAITGAKIRSVQDPFPVVDVSIERAPDMDLGFILTGDLLNPINSEYSISGDTRDDWRVDVYSTVCKLTQNSPPKYYLDCSELDPSIWPHPLSYIFRVFHKNAKVREKHGELFFEGITPASDVPILTNETIDSLILADSSVLSDALGRATNYSEEENSFSNLAFTNNFYYVPPNTTYDVRGTLDLSDSTLVVDEGASLEFWPMAGIKVGNLVVLGQQPASTDEALEANQQRLQIKHLSL